MTITEVRLKLNGQTYIMTKEEGTDNYAVSDLTAPAKPSGINSGGEGPGVGENAAGLGYYPAVIEVEDDAGNVTIINADSADYEDKLKLQVYERTAPVVTFTYPTDGARVIKNQPTIQIKLADSGSGIKPDTARLIIDGGAEIAVAAVQGGDASTYLINYEVPNALADGTHTIKAYCYDYDENKSNEAEISCIVDTVDPSLSLETPEDGVWINTLEFDVVGVTNDLTSSPVVVTAELNGTAAGTASVDAATGRFTKTLTGREGSNSYTITATDSAGRKTSITRTIKIDTHAPVVSSLERTPSGPVPAGSKISFKITATD